MPRPSAATSDTFASRPLTRLTAVATAIAALARATEVSRTRDSARSTTSLPSSQPPPAPTVPRNPRLRRATLHCGWIHGKLIAQVGKGETRR